MKVVKYKNWYESIESWELGFSLVGRPLMTSRFYYFDGMVVDTGPGHLRKEVTGILNERKPEQVCLTHCHEDHSGNASAVKKSFDVPVFGDDYTVKKMGSPLIILPYQILIWGKSQNVNVLPFPDAIETEKYKLIPIHTPGHSKDHTVYLEQRMGWLFSGDLYLGDKIKFFRKDEHFYQEIDSLKKILTYDFQDLFCGHNPVTGSGKDRLKAKLDFLVNFSGEVQSLMKKGCAEEEIIAAMKTENGRFIRWFTLGNVSFDNMVRGAMFDSPITFPEDSR